MRNLIFDYDNGDFIHSASGNTGIDSGGDFHTDMGNNVSIYGYAPGKLHFNSGWKDGNEGKESQVLFIHLYVLIK